MEPHIGQPNAPHSTNLSFEETSNGIYNLFTPQDSNEEYILKLLIQHREKKDEYGVGASSASAIVDIPPAHYQLARIAEKLMRASKIFNDKTKTVCWEEEFDMMCIDIAGHAVLAAVQR